MTNTLIAKIAAASMKVGALKADKRNELQKYDYISADKILDRAGDALAEVGIVITPAIVDESTEEVSYNDQYGKPKTRYDCVLHFMMKVEDGESEMERPWRGRGSDYAAPDKAFYKAITSGHKYFLSKLLNIGVGNEDGEHESHDEQPSQPTQRAAAPPAPKPAPKPAAQQQAQRTGAPSDDINDIIAKWRGPLDAQIWAKAEGYVTNEFEARNSWTNTVKELGGYDGETKMAVFASFVRKHLERQEKVAA